MENKDLEINNKLKKILVNMVNSCGGATPTEKKLNKIIEEIKKIIK